LLLRETQPITHAKAKEPNALAHPQKKYLAT